MDLKFSKVERKGPITIITLSRPEVYNALHIDAHFELNKVFDDFSADPEQWVAVVTGAGDKAFCAGNDLKWQAAGGKRGWDKGGFAGLTSRFDCDKPIIAAVNGVAMGGGFEIALACDLIIASENATFALPEPRVGLAALAGGLHRLPRQIGLKRAMGMILTARHVSAKEGHELGFVNEVVPQGEALSGALRWAEMITKELADVDPGIEADHPEGPRRVTGTGDRGAARISGGEGDGGLAGLYRGPKGILGEAATEMGGEVERRSPRHDDGCPNTTGVMPRLDRGIQYAAASTYLTAVSGILDRPPLCAIAH
ncbi:enoyl-CoA hydratase/carnithine racemase [Bradyrhizobium sp. i1.4.4]